MNIRIYNARILTTSVFIGEIHVRGTKISYIGPGASDDPVCAHKSVQTVWDREIDAKRNLVTASFKNAHTHSPMVFLRSAADDIALEPWLREKVFPAEEKLTEEAVYWFTMVSALEYAAGGITAVFDMYAHRDAVAEAMRSCGIRTVFCGELNDFTSSVPQQEEAYLRYRSRSRADAMIDFRFGFHAQYTTSRENLAALAACAASYGEPVFTHCAETRREVDDCIRHTGMTPVAYMERLGLFENGGGLFHGVYLSAEDVEIIKRHNLWIVTNPASNAKLASGIAPLYELSRAGVSLAIGTDGAASNNALDMFREMYLACVLQKIQSGDPSAMPAKGVLEMAQKGSAHCMGLTDCDALAVGKQADLIMLDMDRPNMRPVNRIAENIVYSGGVHNICMTMCAGRILYENGRWNMPYDVTEIYDRAERQLRSIVG